MTLGNDKKDPSALGAGSGNEQGGQRSDNGSQQGSDNGQSQAVKLEDIQKELQGIQSLVGRFSNEVGETRQLKEKLESIESQLSNLSTQGNETTQKKPPAPIELSAEDETKINERWKQFPQEKREQLIEEADGATRSEKIQNVRAELSRLYAEEGQPIPDELFPTNPDATTKGKTKRAVTTISSLGRELLGIKETGQRRVIPPATQPQGSRSGTAQDGRTEGSRRGRTSGGLAGLADTKN